MYAASYDEKKTFAEQSPLKQNPNFWRHAVHPGYEIKNRSYRVLGKSDVEGAAERYLSQDLRSQLFDRTLVDMLLAREIYAFADEMYHEHTFPDLPPRSPLKWPHPIWTSAKSIVQGTLLFGLIGFLVTQGMNNRLIGDWGQWIVLACVALWALWTLFCVGFVPFAWSARHRARRKVFDLVEAMLSVYSEMSSDSMISAQHIMDRAKSASAQSVVWPSPLFVLLEDVLRRGGRL